MKYHSNSSQATIKLGRAIAARLKKGDAVLLFGELGAGKTTLAKGIIGSYGVARKEVNSPSFVFIREYETKTATIYHFDLYRISDPRQIIDLDYGEIVSSGKGISIIEWAEHIPKDYLPKRYFEVSLKKTGEHFRVIRVKHISS